MTEDEIYRTSSQFKLWSFTKSDLAELRVTTNSAAAESVKAAIENLRRVKVGNGINKAPNESSLASDVDCLTVEEEQKLVQFYCLKAIEFSDFCQYPTVVKVCMATSSYTFITDGALYYVRLQQSNTSNVSTFIIRQ